MELNQIDFRLVIAALLILTGIGAVYTIASGGADTANTNTTSNDTIQYVVREDIDSHVITWPRENGFIGKTDNVEIKEASPLQTRTMLEDDTADIGRVAYPLVGQVVEKNEDLKIVGASYWPKDKELAGIYVREDSGIDSVKDLEGGKIATIRSSVIGAPMLLAMEDKGVNTSNIQMINKPFPIAANLLQGGDVRAAGLTNTEAEGKNFTKILDPRKHFREKYGQRIGLIFYVANGQENVPVARKVFEKDNRSYKVSNERFEEMRESYSQKTGESVPDVYKEWTTRTIYNVDENDVRPMQNILDRMAERGLVPSTTNISAMLADGRE